MKKVRRFSCAFKIAIIICCLIGILCSILNTTSLQSILSFYTIQSNLYVLTFYILYFIINQFNNEWKTSEVYFFLKGATLMIILVTLIIYSIALFPTNFTMDVDISTNFYTISNIFLHFITPIFVLIDYLIFDEKGHFSVKYPIFWYCFPSLYLLYVYVYSFNGGRFFSMGGSSKYAYFFLDVDKIGWLGVFKYLLIFSVMFMIMAYLFVFFDNLIKKRKEKN